jgi:uncharacterized protein DUF4440
MHSRVRHGIALSFVFACFLTSVFTPTGLAAAGNPAQASRSTSSGDVEHAIGVLEASFDAALARRDRAALDNLLADSFVWAGGFARGGRNYSRASFLDEAVQGRALQRQRYPSATLDKALTVHDSTAIRTELVRLRIANGTRDLWLQESRTFVRNGSAWRIAFGMGGLLYEGPIVTAAVYAPYAGTYQIDADRLLHLDWDGNLLVSTYPTTRGAEWQERGHVFLRSPTEEANLVSGGGRFRFVLDENGRPTDVLMMNGDQQVWRARRVK